MACWHIRRRTVRTVEELGAFVGTVAMFTNHTIY